MELVFRTEKKNKELNYLPFLPKNLRFIAALSIILNIVGFLVCLFFYARLQKEIPLFYSLPNDQQLIDKKFIFLLPGLAAIINFVHLFIAYIEKEISHNILKMFVQVTFLLQVLALAILLRIIIIVY